jgi:hypothetical protein
MDTQPNAARRINYIPKNKNQIKQRGNAARPIPLAKIATKIDGPRSASVLLESLPRSFGISSNIVFIIAELKYHQLEVPSAFFPDDAYQPLFPFPEEVILTERYLKRFSQALGRCNRSHRRYYAVRPKIRERFVLHRLQLICALAQTEKTIRFSPPAPPGK